MGGYRLQDAWSLLEVLLAHEYNTCGRRMDKPEVIHRGCLCVGNSRYHRLNIQTGKQDKCIA